MNSVAEKIQDGLLDKLETYRIKNWNGTKNSPASSISTKALIWMVKKYFKSEAIHSLLSQQEPVGFHTYGCDNALKIYLKEDLSKEMYLRMEDGYKERNIAITYLYTSPVPVERGEVEFKIDHDCSCQHGVEYPTICKELACNNLYTKEELSPPIDSKVEDVVEGLEKLKELLKTECPFGEIPNLVDELLTTLKEV